jgi:hypothetical protein
LSWLRPSRTVVDPRGTEWEIYVTRSRIGSWKGLDSPDVEPLGSSPARGGADLWFVLVPVMVVLEIVAGILRLIALVPLSLASAARHRNLRVEAIVSYPARQVYAWDVERDVLDDVLEEITASLERGSIAHPVDARFLGEIE